MAVSRRQLIGDKVSGLCSGMSIVTGRATVFRVVKDAGLGRERERERGYFPLCHIVCTGGGGSFFLFVTLFAPRGGGLLFVTLFARDWERG